MVVGVGKNSLSNIILQYAIVSLKLRKIAAVDSSDFNIPGALFIPVWLFRSYFNRISGTARQVDVIRPALSHALL